MDPALKCGAWGGVQVKVAPFAWKIALLDMMTHEGTSHTYRFDRPYGGEGHMARNDADGKAGRSGYVRAHNPHDALLLVATRMDSAWEADIFLLMSNTVWKEEKLDDRGGFRDALRAHLHAQGDLG